jgi:thioredoxin reductase (NADPH)
VTLVHRGAAIGEGVKYWVKPDIENRIKDGSIQALFNTRVLEIGPTHVTVDGPGGVEKIPADGVFLMTGYTSDNTLLRNSGVTIDPASDGPVHDPETYETNVPGLYVAGAITAGRQSGRVFIENGRFHGEVVIRAIVNALRAPAGIRA